jgi:2-polyprenyl-6-methoxyphenol hydroxylase-like FAD-dependent oxidoreductase
MCIAASGLSFCFINRSSSQSAFQYLGSPELAKDVVNYRDIRNYLSIDQFIEKISTTFSDSGYNFEIGEVKWFSIFKIQEKISADWFAADGRVILVGDACHTHSPGGGLGMQAGMNLFPFFFLVAL